MDNMPRQALALSLLLVLIGVCSAEDIQVISGVFMPRNITVDYVQAKAVCAMHYSRLATLDEVTTAYKKGYEYCKWGWTAENKLVMLRLNPFLACAGYGLGILIRDCPNISSAFCVNATGSVSVVGIEGRTPSYENATLACQDTGLKIATKQQVEDNSTIIPNGSNAWYTWGVGKIEGGNLLTDVCSDTASQASAFCYNPSLADFIINNDDSTLKKIVIGCLLGLIFVVLLFAAACMRGNKFICCMGERKTQPPEVPQSPLPTWNQTGIYRRISQANKGVLYDNLTNVDKRPGAIRPEMNLYKTHYTNMAFDTTGEQ